MENRNQLSLIGLLLPLAMMGSVLVPSEGAAEVASEQACLALFTNKATGPFMPQVATPLSASDPQFFEGRQLNEDSQDFLRLIKFLVYDRRFLPTEVRGQIADSPQPVSPLANVKITIALLPYQQAFEKIPKEELQWADIREIVRAMSGATAAVRQRQAKAVKETDSVVIAATKGIRDFHPTEIVHMQDGRVLGIVGRRDEDAKKTTLLVTDLVTGTAISSVKFEGLGQYETLAVKVNGDQLLAAIPVKESGELVTVDLLARQEISRVSLNRFHFSDLFKRKRETPDYGKAYFIENHD